MLMNKALSIGRNKLYDNRFTFSVVIISIIAWSILFFMQMLMKYDTSVICQQIEFCIDVGNIVLAFMLYHKIDFGKRNVIKYFVLSVVFLFILDVLYYVVYSIPHKWSYVFIFDVFHFTYYAITMLFIVRILAISISKPQHIRKWVLIMFLVDAGIFFIFSIDTKFTHEYFTLRNTIQVVQSTVDLIMFNFALFWLIYSKEIGIAIIAAAYIILAASEFMMTSCYIPNVTELLGWAELFWLLGLIFLMFGMVKLISRKNYNTEDWFSKSTDIRIKFTFSSFIMIVLSLILFFVLIKQVAIINEKLYIFFPTIIMIGSLIITFVSIFIGKTVEDPLVNIQNDISGILSNNKTISDFQIIDSKKYSEIQQIEHQIQQLILIVKQQEKDFAFIAISRKVIHNIKSPLRTALSCNQRLYKNNKLNDNLVRKVNRSLQNMRNQLSQLYNDIDKREYSDKENRQLQCNILFKSYIQEIVIDKMIEQNQSIEIFVDANELNDETWCYVAPYTFVNHISNLLNNAYEAVSHKLNSAVIRVKLYENQENNRLVCEIWDNGRCMDDELLMKAIVGYTTKPNGSGIGLSSAKKYFIEELGGNVSVNSKVNMGTLVKIELLKSDTPKWFIRNIVPSDYVVILDDDYEIHALLQNVLQCVSEVRYFTKIEQFKQWYSNNSENLKDVTYFIDNHIEYHDKLGVDIIESYKINNQAYLMTDDYDDGELQQKIINLNIKMIPKQFIKMVFKNYSYM